MAVAGTEWINRFAERLGVDAPTPEEIDALLGLASTAAHASERAAAPISCWIAAWAGVSPATAASAAAELAAEIEANEP